MISEETAKRIAQALERLADAVERQPVAYQGYWAQPIKPLEPGQCGVCGGYHGGLSCPTFGRVTSMGRKEN